MPPPSSEGELSGMLLPADGFLLFHLALRHPLTAQKLHLPLQGIRYGFHALFPNDKCFNVVLTDGSEVPVSWSKCVKECFASGDGATASRKGARTVDTEPFTELSSTERPLQLIGEAAASAGAAHAERWVYPLRDDRLRSFIGYLSCPVAKDTLRAYYERIETGTTWHQPIHATSKEPIPRKTAWMVSGGCTCTYKYGGVDVSPQPFPSWMEEIMSVYMPLCGIKSRADWPNSCNLNLYVDGSMAVGWHADDEKLFQGRQRGVRIISASFGATRTFEYRCVPPEPGSGRLNLHDGDVCTMEGLSQKHYQHRIPREDASGPRINLTWRWVVVHRVECHCRSQGSSAIDPPDVDAESAPTATAQDVKDVLIDEPEVAGAPASRV